jgi:hypothetical protein
MTDIYRAVVAYLVWLSADPALIDAEPPKAAAAVAAARASLSTEAAPAPDPAPKPVDKCCHECKGLGYVVMPDGHRVKCPCPDDCPCRKRPTAPTPANCPDGKCPLVPGASPASVSPSRPAGGR